MHGATVQCEQNKLRPHRDAWTRSVPSTLHSLTEVLTVDRLKPTTQWKDIKTVRLGALNVFFCHVELIGVCDRISDVQS